jgi:hypothetical protein
MEPMELMEHKVHQDKIELMEPMELMEHKVHKAFEVHEASMEPMELMEHKVHQVLLKYYQIDCILWMAEILLILARPVTHSLRLHAIQET